MKNTDSIKTILIVDDSFENLGVLGNRLKKEGYNILTAVDGKKAIAISRIKQPDLLLIKKNVPEIDGLVVRKILHSHEETSQIRFFILMDKADVNVALDLFEIDESSILVNPVEPEQIVQKINKLFCTISKNSSESGPGEAAKKILLVEDNELNQIYISELLQELNYKVEIAIEGEMALDMISNNLYDIILMDVNIPLINGIELTELLRKERKITTPIIGITGHFEKELIDKCKSAGMNEVVNKPFSKEKLKSVIHSNLTKDTNSQRVTDPQQSNDKLQDKKYNYGQAIKLSNGDKLLFEKWLSRFLGIVANAREFVESSIEAGDFSKRSAVFHELINYSGYFGVDDLRIYIKELQSIQKYTVDNERLENFYRKIKNELIEIEQYFSGLSVGSY